MVWILSGVFLSLSPRPSVVCVGVCACVSCLSRRGLMLRPSVGPCRASRRATLSWRTSFITVPSLCGNSCRNSSRGWVVNLATRPPPHLQSHCPCFKNIKSISHTHKHANTSNSSQLTQANHIRYYRLITPNASESPPSSSQSCRNVPSIHTTRQCYWEPLRSAHVHPVAPGYLSCQWCMLVKCAACKILHYMCDPVICAGLHYSCNCSNN